MKLVEGIDRTLGWRLPGTIFGEGANVIASAQSGPRSGRLRAARGVLPDQLILNSVIGKRHAQAVLTVGRMSDLVPSIG